MHANHRAALDVGAVVSFFQSVSDNTARMVSPTALTGSMPIDLTLECGRFAFTAINSTGLTRVRTRGRVVIVVDGDVVTSNNFQLAPEPGCPPLSCETATGTCVEGLIQ